MQQFKYQSLIYEIIGFNFPNIELLNSGSIYPRNNFPKRFVIKRGFYKLAHSLNQVVYLYLPLNQNFFFANLQARDARNAGVQCIKTEYTLFRELACWRKLHILFCEAGIWTEVAKTTDGPGGIPGSYLLYLVMILISSAPYLGIGIHKFDAEAQTSIQKVLIILSESFSSPVLPYCGISTVQ